MPNVSNVSSELLYLFEALWRQHVDCDSECRLLLPAKETLKAKLFLMFGDYITAHEHVFSAVFQEVVGAFKSNKASLIVVHNQYRGPVIVATNKGAIEALGRLIASVGAALTSSFIWVEPRELRPGEEPSVLFHQPGATCHTPSLDDAEESIWRGTVGLVLRTSGHNPRRFERLGAYRNGAGIEQVSIITTRHSVYLVDPEYGTDRHGSIVSHFSGQEISACRVPPAEETVAAGDIYPLSCTHKSIGYWYRGWSNRIITCISQVPIPTYEYLATAPQSRYRWCSWRNPCSESRPSLEPGDLSTAPEEPAPTRAPATRAAGAPLSLHSALQEKYVLFNHDYKPEPLDKFRLPCENNCEPKYGLELELDCRDRTGEQAVADLTEAGFIRDGWYIKRDGSLNRGTGIELVSHPMTWGYILAEEPLKGVDLLRQRGWRSYSMRRPHGFHVHVDKLERLVERRINAFMAHNSTIVRRLSRRTADSLDHFASLPRIVCCAPPDYFRLITNDCNRYAALNTRLRKTTEFRLFRGNLRYDSLKGSLCWIKAIVAWCAENRGEAKYDNEAFLDFIHGNPSLFGGWREAFEGWYSRSRERGNS